MDIESLCRAEDGRLLALASELDLPHDHDGEVELRRAGDNWLAYSPTQLARQWQFDDGQFVYPIGIKTLHVAARTYFGTETIDGGYWFSDPANAAKALADLGHDLAVPFPDRAITITGDRRGLLVQVDARDGDDLADWERSTRKTKWSRVFGAVPSARHFDDIRWVDQQSDPMPVPDSFYLKIRGRWRQKSAPSIKTVLQSRGLSKPESEMVMGAMHATGLLRVCEPFKSEHPDAHTWNLGAPQLVYQPAPGKHPTWTAMFNHLGRDLDDTLASLPWAAALNWKGADYLAAWYAWIIREPACQLPYLFFFGNENNGKSSYWESFQLLVTRGVVKADRSLTSDHNGELEGAILCAVEERDIASTRGAHARIKDLVTSLTLAIRRMRVDQYQVPNMTHWCQMANHRSACPVFSGDTRITAIAVGPLNREIPKDELFDLLRSEAGAILHTLMTMTLPEVEGRLKLPALATPTKETLQDDNAPDLAKAVVGLMADRHEWRGTSNALYAATDNESCPSDIRRLQRLLQTSKLYLDSHAISFEFPEKRTKNGREVVFHKIENESA